MYDFVFFQLITLIFLLFFSFPPRRKGGDIKREKTPTAETPNPKANFLLLHLIFIAGTILRIKFNFNFIHDTHVVARNLYYHLY